MVHDYPVTHFEALIAHLHHPLSPFFHRKSYGPLVIFRTQPSDHFSPFRTPPFPPQARCATLPPHLPTLNTFVPLPQWGTSYPPLFIGKTHQVMRRTWQRCISWPNHATQGLDSGLPGHASRTSRSIKETRQPPNSPWSPYRVRCQRKAKRPHVFAQTRDWEQVAPPTPKLTPQYTEGFKKPMDLPHNFHLYTAVASFNASMLLLPQYPHSR